jgi:hypothetical protein
MPQISLGGDLPTNPYIQTSDGYKWKYMYTIPGGLKQKFFTKDWMPVVDDLSVKASAVDGRIDIVQIANTGTGYNNGLACTSAQILTVVGDGTGANVTAVTNSTGAIIGTNIISGGKGYRTASINVYAGTAGSNANLIPVISPLGGHGSNNIVELGATNMMICVELDGNMGGLIPTGSSLTPNPIQYYQVSVIQNPLLCDKITYANGSVYATTSKVLTGPVGAGYYFPPTDVAYQGPSAALSTFSGSVVTWDETNSTVYLNNIKGTFTPYSSFTSTQLGINVTAFNLIGPEIDIYSGEILYIQNRSAVSRSTYQTEQIKIVIQV